MCLVPQDYSHLMRLMSRQRISVQLWSRANITGAQGEGPRAPSLFSSDETQSMF